jgi:hypothetical protein
LSFTNSETIIDGINSKDLGINGLTLVRVGENEISTPWIGGKSIIEDSTPFSDVPYFYRTSKQPLEFELKFSLLDDEFNEDRLFELGRIFGQDRYFPIQTTDFLGKIFMVIATSQVNLITYGQFKGWFSVSLRCATPYALSIPQVNTFDFSDITTPTTFEIMAKFNVSDAMGNYWYFPELWVDLKGSSTGFTITNNSDGGRKFGFEDLNLLESLYVNNRLKQIESSTGEYRLANMLYNKSFLRLVSGNNVLVIDKPCLLQFRCQYPIYI